ncbi:NAD(P)-dependent oxidoreductase [Siccirubricoccus sp. KC 17139]|uniref:NAD(P)-dependent oxidoreductase n=1 Tax=Siccirubricoccus soli TaxID=2899147 RepID=A0ABT1D979_9PROT|nr:NAD(P)-dependent oxidoreductase [Siccirubricoccus soli]MCO6418496.1 NAD(P)-dependent oxidoreductase [Siccirubricoccus soli]MCP2684631.1 NAD(P)-dependent oxidoreductase [Siccirubricoccus soli]
MPQGSGPVGFIGLGMMGLPMARSLLRQGRSLVVCDADPVARQAVAEGTAPGAVAVAETPAAVADIADIIVLMLPDSNVVAAVMEGQGGLLPGLRPGQVVIDMGSSRPGETRRLAALAASRGAALLDAPVSGSVVKARAGTLAIMIGGDDAAYAKAEPVLRGMGETLIRTGAVGSAHAMKALNNYVYAAGLLATAEALRMAEASGLDLAIFADVLNASSGRNVATETKVKQEILPGRYQGGFQLGLMRKDLETAGSIAEETGVQAAALALCRGLWNEAVAALGPKADNTEIHRFLGDRR